MPIRRSPNDVRYPRPQPGRDPPEQVVAINRNAWSQSSGARSLQFANLFPLEIQRIDPAFDLLYSTMGILVSAATGLYFGLKKNWSLVAGLALGILLWWPFVGILMTIQGVWF